jgi:biotin synthase
MDELLKKALEKPHNLTTDELVELLSISSHEDMGKLFKAAYSLKERYIGRRVSIRGLIEWSNICNKNCFYCGIRSGNKKIERFRLSKEEILSTAEFIHSAGYGSLVLQGGELESPVNTDFISSVLSEIKLRWGNGLGVTLSLGEQEESVYQKWRNAGAHRYLLRIESSNPEIYKKLHPLGHSFERRVECLHTLKRLGYQLGTGVMIGLPGQTLLDLAHDIEFFAKVDADMIGMGPYIPHADTPLGENIPITAEYMQQQLLLGLKMIAVTRLYLHDVNIASTTALQALAPDGRERGLLAGANVIMPNATAVGYRAGYQLYANKPNLDENAEETMAALEASVKSIGETLRLNELGDSPHAKA